MCTKPIQVPKQGTVPCGQCLECKKKTTREWAMRIVHESMLYKDNSFLTITYNDENVPYGYVVDDESGELIKTCPTLKKYHLREFVKKLRDKGYKFRYYGSGEYGLEGEREINPHYHLIVFGIYWYPEKFKISEELTNIWGKGNVYVGTVQWESAAYTAKYIQKRMMGAYAQGYEMEGIEQEFAIMSRGGNSPEGKNMKGIGYKYYKDFIEPMLEIEDPTIAFRGKMLKPSKYYMDKFWLGPDENKDNPDPKYQAYKLAHRQKADYDILMEGYEYTNKTKHKLKDKAEVLKERNEQINKNLERQDINKKLQAIGERRK